MERLDGDQELLQMLVAVFHDDSVQLLQQIADGLQRGDVKLVERSAHSLKGLAANFDAASAQQAAAAIEESARRGVAEGLESMLRDLRREIDSLSRSLRHWESTLD